MGVIKFLCNKGKMEVCMKLDMIIPFICTVFGLDSFDAVAVSFFLFDIFVLYLIMYVLLKVIFMSLNF